MACADALPNKPRTARLRRAFIRSPIARAALRSRRTVKVSQPRAVSTARVHVRASRGQAEVLRAAGRVHKSRGSLIRIEVVVRVHVVPRRDSVLDATSSADVVPEVTARGRDRRINLEAPTPNLAPHVNDRVVLDHRNALGHSGIPAHRDPVTARLIAEVAPSMEAVLTKQIFRASVRVDKQAITAAARVPAVPSV